MLFDGPATLASLYSANAAYVAGVLRRLGIGPSDIDDLVQEVFVVVLKRLTAYEHRGREQAWLFGICLRVAAAHRRRAFRRHERAAGSDCGVTVPWEGGDPEDATLARHRRRRLEQLLGEMLPEQRTVLELFELEELGCPEIARVMATPVGTVYSRLHAARRELARLAARARRREAAAMSRADGAAA